MYESHGIGAAASPPPPEDDGLPPRRRRWALTAIYSALVLVVVDGAVVNVALPTIGETLHVGSAASVAVATSYQLAVVISLLPFSALGESVGPRRVFVSGAAVFIAASALCAMSPSLGFLVAARFLQGLGGGAIMALNAMLLRYSMPRNRLAAAIGWNAVMVALSGAAGPSIGAFILSIASWRWIFAVNLPIGVLALVVARALPRVPGSGNRVDAISAAMSAGLFMLFFVGAGRIAEQPAVGLGLIVAAAVCLIGLIRRERGRAAPLVPVDLFADLAFRRTVLASAATFCAQMMSGIALPFHLQRALGASVLATGAYMSAWPIAIVASASFAGRLAGRMPASRLCSIGTSVLAIALAAAGLAPSAGGVLPILALMALAGLGFGIFQPANNRLLLLSAPKARSGAAGGVQGTTRLVGQTLGATILTALFQLIAGDMAPRVGLVVAAGFALLAAMIGAANARRTG
jgi:DHA2 family multidrug resistance protein-like MFS transporter